MNKMRLLIGGASIVLSCAPAFSQGASPTTTNNYKGLQNLVDGVNSPATNPGAGSGNTGAPRRMGGQGGHKWQGGGGGGGGAANGTGAGVGTGAGPLGAGADATGQGGQGGDPAKREARRLKMMQRFDTNGDGVLDENEKAKLQAFRAEKRAQREAAMGQAGGGGVGAGAGNGPGGPGGPAGGGGPGHHRHRDGMPGAANQSADSQPGLPGGRRGAPGDFPKGFQDGTGGASTPSNP